MMHFHGAQNNKRHLVACHKCNKEKKKAAKMIFLGRSESLLEIVPGGMDNEWSKLPQLMQPGASML